MKETFLNKNFDSKKLNLDGFEYSAVTKNKILQYYVHVDYYLKHESEFNDYEVDCPKCGKPVRPRNNVERRNCWYRKHTCYSQPTITSDNGKVKFNITQIIEHKVPRPVKIERTPGGKGGDTGGDIEPTKPDEFTPIEEEKKTIVRTVKKAWELYKAKLGYIKASNGRLINELVCDQENFTMWSGDLNKKTLILDLVTCKPSELDLPQSKECIWLKIPKKYDRKNNTYIQVKFYFHSDYVYYRSQIIGNKPKNKTSEKSDKKTTVRLMGKINALNTKSSGKLNLYRVRIYNYQCFDVENGKDEEDE